jgi:glycosyltransferase involved in cell wall biosynthesis
MQPQRVSSTSEPFPIAPKLTVVIPTYNCAKWLNRAVGSVGTLSGCDIQLIIVDDGSTDETPEVLLRLSAEFPSLLILNKPNGGLSSARNLGLTHTQGRYVLFLDADDMLIPCDVSVFVDSGCHMIRIGVEEVSAGEHPLARTESMRILSGREYLADGFKNNSFYTSSCAYIYQVDWLRRSALSFEDNLLHEDNLFTVQALLNAATVLVVPTLLYRYIRRADSITMSQDHDKLLARVHAYVRIAGMLTTIGNKDPSFDLRWKIQEVLDGAQRLATRCENRSGQMIVLRGLLRFIFSHRGFGGHAFQYKQLTRVLKYLRCLVIPH